MLTIHHSAVSCGADPPGGFRGGRTLSRLSIFSARLVCGVSAACCSRLLLICFGALESNKGLSEPLAENRNECREDVLVRGPADSQLVETFSGLYWVCVKGCLCFLPAHTLTPHSSPCCQIFGEALGV